MIDCLALLQRIDDLEETRKLDSENASSSQIQGQNVPPPTQITPPEDKPATEHGTHTNDLSLIPSEDISHKWHTKAGTMHIAQLRDSKLDTEPDITPHIPDPLTDKHSTKLSNYIYTTWYKPDKDMSGEPAQKQHTPDLSTEQKPAQVEQQEGVTSAQSAGIGHKWHAASWMGKQIGPEDSAPVWQGPDAAHWYTSQDGGTWDQTEHDQWSAHTNWQDAKHWNNPLSEEEKQQITSRMWPGTQMP